MGLTTTYRAKSRHRLTAGVAADTGAEPLRCLSVDVEEYFHIEAAYGAIAKEQWADWPSLVKRNVDLLLDLFARYRRRYTFFVLGDVAREPPTHSTLAASRCSLECVDEFTWRWS